VLLGFSAFWFSTYIFVHVGICLLASKIVTLEAVFGLKRKPVA
jgi:hypothetical protein